MKYSNAIKKLKKNGFEVVEKEARQGSVIATMGETEISFFCNGRFSEDANITCIRVRDIEDKDDSYSDYCAGVFADNLSQAIKLAGR